MTNSTEEWGGEEHVPTMFLIDPEDKLSVALGCIIAVCIYALRIAISQPVHENKCMATFDHVPEKDLEKEVQTTKIQQDQLAACHQAGS
jgi:hypothetical protein